LQDQKAAIILKYAQAIDPGYVVNFNKRHLRHGHLLHNRYKSIVCQEDAYLLGLVCYIHLNLLRAAGQIALVSSFGVGRICGQRLAGHAVCVVFFWERS